MTTNFVYTHRHDADSSLADAVFYNEDSYTLAVQFKGYGYGSPSAFYFGVPKSVYDGLVNADSLGQEYNKSVKNKFHNVTAGTVMGVVYKEDPAVTEKKAVEVKEEENFNYTVHGYIRQKLNFAAKNREEARESFIEYLRNEGLEDSEIAVTEVVILG